MEQKEALVIWKKGMAFDGIARGFAIPIDDGPSGPNPMDLVLLALAGCTAMDIISILEKKRQQVDGFEVRTCGVRADTYPRVYTDIRLEYALRGPDIDPAAVESAIKLSEEKYCSVLGMLKASVNITTTYRIEKTVTPA